jgi:hypothetical protein
MNERTSIVNVSGDYEETVERLAKHLGKNKLRRLIFNAIYGRTMLPRSKRQIMASTNMPDKGNNSQQVQNQLDHLSKHHLISKIENDGSVEDGSRNLYLKDKTVRAIRKEVVQMADNPRAAASISTKRRVVVAVPKFVRISVTGAKIKRVTIDDIDTFGKVKKIKRADSIGPHVSEDVFKRGLRAIIGEPGTTKDWGGEKSDLYSTRIRVGGKRLAAAFALKGPGLKQKLTPGRMGKNGDQVQRLFHEDADVFVVQHWREIDPSVIGLLRDLSVAKSVSTGRLVRYGIIDGEDSERLRLAYPRQFSGRIAKNKK